MPPKVNRLSLGQVGKDTLAIIANGWYSSSDGTKVEVAEWIAKSVADTQLYEPSDFDRILLQKQPTGSVATKFEVTEETSLGACRRIIVDENAFDGSHVACLNFASGKNPGGGFLGGAISQEENLARSSALYASLTCPTAAMYYHCNKAIKPNRGIYSDHLIWSPNVVVFREDDYSLVAHPFIVNFITSPAVNAGVLQRFGSQNKKEDNNIALELDTVMRRRLRTILATALEHKQRCLVLGAWGTGCFRNDVNQVAEWFHDALTGDFAGCFERVVFAVLDNTTDRRKLAAFAQRFVD